jgi:hypothetical protein
MIELPYNLEISLLGIYPKSRSQRNISKHMVIAVYSQYQKIRSNPSSHLYRNRTVRTYNRSLFSFTKAGNFDIMLHHKP